MPRPADQFPAFPWRGIRIVAPLLLLCALAACGGRAPLANGGGYSNGPSNYMPPGPPADPWGPYIRAASSRFDVPEQWVREVMRQESGGHQYLNGRLTTSDAGAAGLMQLMPATYAELQARYGLGGDIYDPHDNIFAGTAYIGELYALYGSPAFLAAYNAGPHRLDDYLAGNGELPNETINYLASIAPRLGPGRAMSGPLAAYADSGGGIPGGSAQPPVEVAAAPTQSSRPSGCQDPDAAYDPDARCPSPAPQTRIAEASPLPPPTAPGSVIWNGPANPPPAAAPPASPSRGLLLGLVPAAAAAPVELPRSGGEWGIQVGAFADRDVATSVAAGARARALDSLESAHVTLGATTPFGGRVLYRARLVGVSAASAANACRELTAQNQACVIVPPGA